MPSGLGHFIVGFAILIPIIYYTDGEFNKKVAAIFLINNWVGPDSAQAYFFLEPLIGIDFHWFIPFLIWAIPLALFFSYFSRFSVKKTEKFFTIVDDGIREVNWKNSYLLCVSGGLLHTITDAIFRHNTYDSTIKLLNNVLEPKLGELYYIASYGTEVGILQILPFVIMLIIIFLAVYIVEQEYKDILIVYIIIGGITLLLTFSFGDKIIGEEYDIAVFILASVFILLPIILLFYVEKDVKNNPVSAPAAPPRLKAELGLKIISISLLTISICFLALGIVIITNITNFSNLLDINYDLVMLIGFLILFAAIFMLLGAIGLFLKNYICRYIIMFACALMAVFIFPLVIFYYLCQEDVKSLFNK
ncbi:MAG: hypothetical protein ACTSQJ_04100 [Promethearchaeota archaeon]